MPNASPRAPRSPRAIWTLIAVAGVALGAGAVHAGVTRVDGAATAESPAERIVVTGNGLLFPIDPSPRCDVLDNYGGHSKTFGSGGHQGVDIGANEWQEVYAVEHGILYRQFVDGSPGLGWGLHSVTDTKYRYFHLAAFADGLEVGDEVEEGQIIGYVGDTGNATEDGWHLHFEVRPGPDHDPVDPTPLLDIPTICNVY